MKIGFVGLGKLGLPVATCMDMKGHDVMGYDVDPSRMTKEAQSYQEAGPDGVGDFNDYLAKSDLKFGSLEKVVEHGDLIFVAVQTPHDPQFEGITPIPRARKNFNYSFLQSACGRIDKICQETGEKKIVVIISTCLPGTVDLLKRAWRHLRVVYNPFFIAMGTTMRDFLDPEFILMGVEDEEAAALVKSFYCSISHAPICSMSIASAELTKVSYNTYISSKIAFANIVMEICEHFSNADCDEVVDALSHAHRRLISSAYLRGGMGDGGGCHPRDNIAMSWLAQQHNLSHDLFDNLMKCREHQSQWLMKLAVNMAASRQMKHIQILGYAFKPETNLTVGSPAILLKNQLKEKHGTIFEVSMFDPSVQEDEDWEPNKQPTLYIIGCKHEVFREYRFPAGSVVLDPHRYIPDQEGVYVHRIGERV